MRFPPRRLHCRSRYVFLLAVYTTVVIVATLYVSSLAHRSHLTQLETRLARSPPTIAAPHRFPAHRHSPVPGIRPGPSDNGGKKEKETIHNRNAAGLHGVGLPSVKRVHGFVGGDCPAIRSPIVEYLTPNKDGQLSDKQKVMAVCNQAAHITLDSFFTTSMRKTVRKLGEGVFGEVFHVFTEERDNLALKIVPIETDVKVNDERQSTYAEVLPELVISKELSDLALDKENSLHYTKNFVHIHKMGLCRSAYPEFLIDAWDQWDDEENSENDRPDIFGEDQQYIVFAYENAGIALERFTFQSSHEARSVIAQIAGALAVAEEALKFEHRDLHRGNILVRRTKDPTVVFVMNGQRYELPSHGVLVTIIDYTLSRLSQGDCVSFNDLNNLPWVFQGKQGALQFDTYRLMRNCTGNDWSKFAPKTNALWLHYIVNRVSAKGRHKNLTRKQMQTRLKPYLNKFKSLESAKHIFLSLFADNPKQQKAHPVPKQTN